MSDNWEDWESDDFVVPIINEQQTKQLEERKLVEESDNKLTNDLFSNEGESLAHEDSIKNVNKPLLVPKSEKKTQKFASKKLENEARQKELSKKNKEEKARREKARELFGEAEEDDEYAKYEDQFY